MTWLLVLAAALIVVGGLSLATLAQAARQYRQWAEPPLTLKRDAWRKDRRR
jgi:hypothetical protein